MTGLGDLVGDVAGVAGGQLWKIATIVLAFLLLGTAGGLGFEWWLAARDRDVAREDLTAERAISAQLRASINLQNTAVEALGDKVRDAEARRDVAERYAEITIKATGTRQAAARASAATNCDGVLREAWGQR